MAELRNAVSEIDRQRPGTMEIGGYRAVIQFDPDIEMFRSEFVGLNGGADFYARDVSGLRREGAMSLKVFLEMCEEDGVEPGRTYSGRFNLRLPSELHADVAAAAREANTPIRSPPPQMGAIPNIRYHIQDCGAQAFPSRPARSTPAVAPAMPGGAEL